MIECPRLLKYDREIYFPERILTDLKLNDLISSESARVLLHPCGRDIIPMRQELFALLSKYEALRDRLKRTVVLLKERRMLIEFEESNNNKFVRYRTKIRILENFAAICCEFENYRDCGTLLGEVAAFFSSDGIVEILKAIDETLRSAGETWEKVDHVSISLSQKSVMYKSDDAPSFVDRVSSLAREMNITPPEKSRLQMNADDAFIDSYLRIFRGDIDKDYRIDELTDRALEYDLAGYIDELGFFIEITEFYNKAALHGLPLCFPRVSEEREYIAENMYDVTLLGKEDTIVPNDVRFSEYNSIFFLIGANGGGKTTYLRTIGVGMLSFLSGCPVCAESASIFPFDSVLTHFPADERFDNVGRLRDEQDRVEKMLQNSCGQSFLLFNEAFSGTDENKGYECLVELSQRISGKHFALFVTHFQQIADSDRRILCTVVDEADENRRTYKIAFGGGESSYANDILKKYRLDKGSLEKRGIGYGI